MRTTISVGLDNVAESTLVRMSSRSRRLSRFRATADCLYRGTIRPIRMVSSCRRARGEATTRTSRCPARMRFPSRAMRCNSTPRVMRAARGKPSGAWGVLGSRVFVRNPDSQLFPPLLTATGERCTAPFRFHPRTESMRLQPARIARAIGRLAHYYSRYGLIRDASTER